MELGFRDFYKIANKIIQGPVVDLSEIGFVYPWGIIMVCLSLAERKNLQDKRIILPKKEEILLYLKRVRFDSILEELNYLEAASSLRKIEIPEKRNLNVQEIIHCQYRDGFNAYLEHFIRMFINFGLNDDNAKLATAVLGELGNNVFDHNLGSWPTDVVGCFVAGQNYPIKKMIQFTIGDPGIGFLGSLKSAYPELKNDCEAIKKGLSGYSGRIPEKRGNGLKWVQNWTLNNFSGKLAIHSGACLVEVDKDGMKEWPVNKITGTLAQFMIYYK